MEKRSLQELITAAMELDAKIPDAKREADEARSRLTSAECAAVNAWNLVHKELAAYEGIGFRRSDLFPSRGIPVERP